MRYAYMGLSGQLTNGRFSVRSPGLLTYSLDIIRRG